MATIDEGWMDASNCKDELPFGNFEDGSGTTESYDTADVIGVCPVCGTHVVERDRGFFCNNMDCSFALWKNNRFFETIGKEMTREIAEALVECGTVKLDGCVSKRTGNTFNCYVDLTTDEEQRPHFEIRFPKRKKGGQ